ncbi:MAG: aminoacetone oxidase family FAD-binding enzyme, partial [Verrucomicrobiota bacterium]
SVSARVSGTPLKAYGPCLITHWGLSGPAILKLSAWGARLLNSTEYRFEVKINWLGDLKAEEVDSLLQDQRESAPKKLVESGCEGIGVPLRVWKLLVEAAGIGKVTWSNLPKASRQSLIAQLTDSTFSVEGKSMNKDEFVTAGGVNLKEVNFKTMESRLIPNLFFAGEVLDIDGITGGFNFQAAWTTSMIAGESAADLMPPKNS